MKPNLGHKHRFAPYNAGGNGVGVGAGEGAEDC